MQKIALEMETTTDALLIVIDNDKPSYDACMESAMEAIAEAANFEQVKSGIWTEKEAARFFAADWIKNYIETLIDDVSAIKPESKWCIAVTLIRCAFEDLDFDAMACHYIDKVKEAAAGLIRKGLGVVVTTTPKDA